MKKYAAILFASFIILVSFSVSSASASNCASGELFNTATGQACTTTTLHADCQAGDLFSSATGAPCTGTSQNDSSDVSTFSSLLKTNFRVGLKGNNDVKALQQFLKDQGYYFGKVDGSYGRITDRAVGDFRADNNLTPNPPTTPPTTPPTLPPTTPPTPSSSITILSPHGGEVWTKGTTQTIAWQDTNDISTHEIKLNPYYQPCTAGSMCPMTSLYRVSYTIANTQGSSYSWSVGSIMAGQDSSQVAPDGTYTIQVCQTGTSVCGYGNYYFKITSATSTGSSPVISGVKGPQSLNVNQHETWTVTAYDPNGGNLSYSVVWGDESTYANGTSSSMSPTAVVPQQSATFTHSYSQAGTYNPTFTVTNTSGQSAKTSLSVNIGTSSSTNHPPVLQTPTTQSSVAVGQSASFNFSATDSDNDDLSWIVGWGETTPVTAGVCSLNSSTGTGQNWNYNTSHTWNTAGNYVVKVYVTDCKGGVASTTFTVNVGGVSATATYHSADTNHDWKIDDSELANFLTLYNYRSGTERTGEYSVKVWASGENGGSYPTTYVPGPGSHDAPTHSADENKDWKISLTELTRVIELHNATGGYQVQAGTEDGFAPIYSPTTAPVPGANSPVSYNLGSLGLSASASSAFASFPLGCSSKSGFSITTGQSCSK